MLGVLLAQADESIEEALPEGLTTSDWIAAGAIMAAAVLLYVVVKRVTARIVGRGDSEFAAADAVGRLLGYVFLFAGLIWALSVLDVRIAPLLGAFGIGAVAVAFAAQSILENFFSSIVLRTRRPFRRGDQIQTSKLEGTVEEVNFRTLVLRTYDGERVLIPCADVLSSPIVNHTVNGRRRTTLTVGVAYDTDLATAQRILTEGVASVDGVLPSPAPEALVEELGESSIDFAVRFWHAPDITTLWRVRSEVAIAVKGALDEAGIGIPFPQRTLWFGRAGDAEADAAAADEVDLRVVDGRRPGAEQRVP